MCDVCGCGDSRLVPVELHERLLADNDELRRGRYSVIVRIWVDEDGRLTKSELVGTSGDAARDSAFARALEGGATLSQSPPEDMPPPIKLRRRTTSAPSL
jgi:protein TonB